ncbi:MAG: hypothetical protein IJ661_01135 [Lachnospiraceae bacterium]|nr:hypothetical protein [Lachnospiraceae bacterium]
MCIDTFVIETYILILKEEIIIKILELPLVIDRWDFLFNHLDCDCIVDKTNEKETGKVRVIAYAENKADNINLRNYFQQNNYKGKYVILQGIARCEVNRSC